MSRRILSARSTGSPARNSRPLCSCCTISAGPPILGAINGQAEAIASRAVIEKLSYREAHDGKERLSAQSEDLRSGAKAHPFDLTSCGRIGEPPPEIVLSLEATALLIGDAVVISDHGQCRIGFVAQHPGKGIQQNVSTLDAIESADEQQTVRVAATGRPAGIFRHRRNRVRDNLGLGEWQVNRMLPRG